VATFFNEFFGVSVAKIDKYGAFNISLINDLPLFIDPFLLFNSKKQEYQVLHDDIIRYMMYLRDKTIGRTRSGAGSAHHSRCGSSCRR